MTLALASSLAFVRKWYLGFVLNTTNMRPGSYLSHSNRLVERAGSQPPLGFVSESGSNLIHPVSEHL